MAWVPIIAIIILSFFLIILFRPLHIAITIKVLQDTQFVLLSLTLCKITIYQKEWSIENKTSDSNSPDVSTTMDVFIALLRTTMTPDNEIHLKYKKIKQLYYYIESNGTLRYFSWETVVGTGNASTTGMIAGGMWTAKQTIHLTLLKMKYIKCHPQLNIIPNFQRKEFSTQLQCIISLRLGKAIFIAWMYSKQQPI